MQARSPAFLLKWQRILRHKQQNPGQPGTGAAGRARAQGAGDRPASAVDHRTAGLNPPDPARAEPPLARMTSNQALAQRSSIPGSRAAHPGPAPQ